jgi:hypothetical protein
MAIVLHNLTDAALTWRLPDKMRQASKPTLAINEGAVTLPAFTSIVLAD